MRSVFRRSRSPRRRGKTADELIKDVKAKEEEFYAGQISALETANGGPTLGGKSQRRSRSQHRRDHPSLACVFRSTSYQGDETYEGNGKNVATMEDFTETRPQSIMSDHIGEEKERRQHRRSRSLSRLFRPINRNNLDVRKENQTKQEDAKIVKEADRKQPKEKANRELSSLFNTLSLAKCARPMLPGSIPIGGKNYTSEERDIKQIQAALKRLEKNLLDAKRSGEEVNRTKVMNDLLAVVATVNQAPPSDEFSVKDINSLCISTIEQTAGVSLNSSITSDDYGSDVSSTDSNDFMDHLEVFTFQQLGTIWKSFIESTSDDSSSPGDSYKEIESSTQTNSSSTIRKLPLECNSTNTAETESLSVDGVNDAPIKEVDIQDRAAAVMSKEMISFPRVKMENAQLCSGNNLTCGFPKDSSNGCHPLSWMKLNEEEMNKLLDDLFWGANTFEQNSSKNDGKSKKEPLRKNVSAVLAESDKENFKLDPFDEIVASRPHFKRSWTIEEREHSNNSFGTSESNEPTKTKSFFQAHGKKYRGNTRPPTNILLSIDDCVQRSCISHNPPKLDFGDDVYGHERNASNNSKNRGRYTNEMNSYLDAGGY